MPYYLFHQNNSYGKWDPPAIDVFIKAETAEEANKKAIATELYFDGCETGRDCSCCGDRWHPVEDAEWDAYEEPVKDYFGSEKMYKSWAEDAGIPLMLVID